PRRRTEARLPEGITKPTPRAPPRRTLSLGAPSPERRAPPPAPRPRRAARPPLRRTRPGARARLPHGRPRPHRPRRALGRRTTDAGRRTTRGWPPPVVHQPSSARRRPRALPPRPRHPRRAARGGARERMARGGRDRRRHRGRPRRDGDAATALVGGPQPPLPRPERLGLRPLGRQARPLLLRRPPDAGVPELPPLGGRLGGPGAAVGRRRRVHEHALL